MRSQESETPKRDTLRTRVSPGDRLPRLLLAVLLSFGLLLPVLPVLDLMKDPLLCFAVTLALDLALECATLNKKTRIVGLPALGILLVVGISACGGLGTLRDIFTALSLRLSGISSALPFVARETALLFAVLAALLGTLCSRSSAGYYPAILLTFLTAVVLWLSDRPDLLPTLIPAVLAAFLLLLMDRHGEASPLRLFPLGLFLVIGAFLLTPRSGVTFAPLKNSADRLRQSIMDRLFFTEPRDVFSLSAEGYYPQGLSQLGGPADPTDHPVMQVSTPRTVYLRGVILNEYDGRCWRNTLGGRRYLWSSSSPAARRRSLFNQALPNERLSASQTQSETISVRMLCDGASTLFLPQRVRELRVGGELVPYFAESTEVFATRNIKSGDTWSVTAPLFTAGAPGLGTLIQAASVTPDDQWEELLELYTVLPSHLEEPVWQIATDLTRELTSPYDKACAIRDWLSRNFRYNLTVEIQPTDMDFVTHFLLDTREGYCTYFASAMTVLCRMAGLPARYVEGYLAKPDENGEALVTGLDAHAWTEVCFNGFGWLTFDATPLRSDSGSDTPPGPSASTPPPDTSETEEPTPSPEPEPENTPESEPDGSEDPESTPSPELPEESPDTDPEDPESEDEPLVSLFPFLLLLLLLILIAAISVRWFLTSPARREKKTADPGKRFEIWLRETVYLLTAEKQTRRSGETPMSYTRRLDASGLLPVSMSMLGECVSLLRYSKLPPMETDVDLCRNVALGLRSGLSFSARVRYFMIRLRGQKKAGSL